MLEVLDHLRLVEEFIREYPVSPDRKVVHPGRGLVVGSPQIVVRDNPWSVYQDLANHIRDYREELILQTEAKLEARKSAMGVE